jgi:hypothetical protein
LKTAYFKVIPSYYNSNIILNNLHNLTKIITILFLIVGIIIHLTLLKAYAFPITIDFDGYIYPGTDPALYKNEMGEYYFGQYTFESTTSGSQSVTNFGFLPKWRMVYPGAILSFWVNIDGNLYTCDGNGQNGIIIDHGNGTSDDYFVILTSGSGYEQLYIDLRSSNTDLFSKLDLPLLLPDISNFDRSTFFRLMFDGINYWGTLNGEPYPVHPVTPVPIPSTFLLLFTGLSWFLLYYYDKKLSFKN